jgi:acetylornithine aminotransferase
MGSLMHAGYCYSSTILEDASKSVLNIVNFSGGKCVFLCSGSEAIEISRQIARNLTGKKLSMTLHDSYLGAYSSATDRTQGWYVFNWEGCKTCSNRGSCDPGCDTLKDIPDDISDFIFEPGSSSGYVRFPPKALVQNLIDHVRQRKGKIIANEVTTGVGRTGKWFGYHHYDIEPDLVALGKGIGNGYPVSIAAMSKGTVDGLEAKPFKYGQSHLNDPLGAAVVKEVIGEIEDKGLIEKAARKGALFLSCLESLVDESIVTAVRGRGLMFAVDLANSQITNQIHSELIERGYIVGNRGAAFRIDPPLITTEEEFDKFINAFRAVLTSKKGINPS